MSVSVTLKSYFYEVLIPSSQKNTSSPIEDILHHVSISFMKKLALYKCFNPRTHTGCDFSLFFIYLIIDVSIHAPTRGATTCPPRKSLYLWRFNPRTHTGCDNRRHVGGNNQHCFNPRTHTGCDVGNKFLIYMSQLFQSTHPHGVRPDFPALISIRPCFNPRTHTGCD